MQNPIPRRRIAVSIAAILSCSRTASPQFAPIDLGIPNIQQQTPVWCWVAVVEQVLRWKTGRSPSQGELVSIANGWPPQTCLFPPNPMIANQCMRTGGLHEIGALLGMFGGGMTSLAPPASPNVIYQQIMNGRAIILALQSTPFTGHVVVLRGIIPAQNPLFIINDPMGWNNFSQPWPFSSLIQVWRSAILVT